MHSIITNKDTYVGVLTKMSFDLCFLDISEHFKNNLHSLILGSKLLKRLDSKIFKISYFSLFFHEINQKNAKILIQDQPNDYIYLIKTGDYEVSMKKSIIDMNFIIKHFGVDPIKERLPDKQCKLLLILDNKAIKNYMEEKKEIKVKFISIKIGIFKSGEIIGLNDMEYEDSSLFTVECVSEKGEIIKFSKTVKSLLN